MCERFALTWSARVYRAWHACIAVPVQWTGCVAAIAAAGVVDIVECGPGKVLSGLNRRIDKTLRSHSLEQPDELASTLQALT